MPTTAETPATTPNKTTRSVESPSADKAMITPISMVTPFSRLAARAAAPRAGYPESNIFLFARLRIVNSVGLPEFQSVRDPVPVSINYSTLLQLSAQVLYPISFSLPFLVS